MSEYTSTIEGFQRAMEWSLTGSPESAKEYVEATSAPGFYHIMNGVRSEGDAFAQGISEWRGKISEYKPVVDEFLRDGDNLAAHMTGTIKVDGADVEFESFMFAKVDKATGRLTSMIERSVWGAAGQKPTEGVN